MKFRVPRLLIALPVIACVLLPQAWACAPESMPLHGSNWGGSSGSPSQLDYVVLASMADSSNWLVMSAYEAKARKAELRGGGVGGEYR